jgi:hypothetical protein
MWWRIVLRSRLSRSDSALLGMNERGAGVTFMAIEGEVITLERDLLLQLIKLYKTCRIEARAAKAVIAGLSSEHAELGPFLEAERQKWILRAEHVAVGEFRAVEAALLGQKPYLPALRVLLGRHRPKPASGR